MDREKSEERWEKAKRLDEAHAINMQKLQSECAHNDRDRSVMNLEWQKLKVDEIRLALQLQKQRIKANELDLEHNKVLGDIRDDVREMTKVLRTITTVTATSG